jgi:protein phosphatase
MDINIWEKTSRGLSRHINQDNYGYLSKMPDSEINLVAVIADGLGGLANGDIASKTAVDYFLNVYKNNITSSPNSHKSLINLFSEINQYVYDIGITGESMHQNPKDPSMATTLSSTIFSDNVVRICHIGDSRVYLFRDNSLHLLSEDHSWVSEAIQAGILTEEDARNHPMSNVVTQVIGSPQLIHPFYKEIEILSNDIILLCTDGVHGSLTDTDIKNEIQRNCSMNSLLNSLFSMAKLNGSTDDMTAILINL